MTTKDHYETLGVSREATTAEIKAAYKKLAKKHHPDINQDAGSEKKFKEISQAYQILSDSQKKAAYDRLGHTQFEQARKSGFTGGTSGFGGYQVNLEDLFRGFGGFRDPFDLFEDFFGFRGYGTHQRARPRHGEDIETIVKVSFEEAVYGVEKEISFQPYVSCQNCNGFGSKGGKKSLSICDQCQGKGQVRRQQAIFGAAFTQITTCPKCQGKGQINVNPCPKCLGSGRRREKVKLTINVPAGIDTGMQVRYSHKGNIGEQNAPRGHLYVTFKVEPHKFFTRDRKNINLDLPISIPQAVLGDTIKIPTINGEKKLKIPAGTQSGQKFKLKNIGVPDLHSRLKERGDQIVQVQIKIPDKLNRKQRELYKNLQELDQTPRSLLNDLFS